MPKLGFSFSAVLGLTCLFHVALGKTVFIHLAEKSTQFRGAVAEFGYQFDQQVVHPANLMLVPKDDPYLCSYPLTLENAPSQNSSLPVALFVSRGECSFQEKGEVALALRQILTQDIQYVIIYNNDLENPSDTIQMAANDFNTSTIGFVFISTRAGYYTMSEMLLHAENTQQSPFLSANSSEWEYPIEIHSYSGRSSTMNVFSLLSFCPIYIINHGLLVVESHESSPARQSSCGESKRSL